MTTPHEQNEGLVRAQRALDENPGDTKLMIDYAECLLADGQFGRGMEVAQRAADLAPDDFRVLRFLSGAQTALGDLPGAAKSGERAVRIDRSNVEARLHVAGVHVAMGQSVLALPHLMAAVNGPKPSAYAWRLLSTALAEMGRMERAIEAVDHAIAGAPDEIEYLLHRASLLTERRRYDEALAQMDLVLQQDPDQAAALVVRSGLLETLGRSESALADAERAAALKPDEAGYRWHLAHLRARAGLAEGVPIPDDADLAAQAEHWAASHLPPVRSRPPPAAGFVAACRLQARIVLSILLREMRTRFGRSRLGYFWAVVEPIGHLATLGSVFSYLNHGRPPLGTDLYVFYITGLVPYLMFSHVVGELMPLLSSSGAVLSLPIVRQIDVIAAKSLLVLATDGLVAFIMMAAFTLMGRPGLPADLLPCMMALGAVWLLGVGFGTVNMIIVEYFPTWETIVQALLRVMYFGSGIYYSPLAMPSWLRNVLTLNPVLQCVEWFRSGFFAQYEPHWLDIGYLFSWIVGLMLIGFALLRTLRRRLVAIG